MWRQQPAITCILGAGLQACEVGRHHIQQLIILSKQPATVLEKEANRVSLRDRPIVGGEPFVQRDAKPEIGVHQSCK